MFLCRTLARSKSAPSSSVQLLLLPLYMSNFVGLVVARSLHYQFYVWYYHQVFTKPSLVDSGLGWGQDFFYLFLPYIALISVFASQMALLGFFRNSSLLFNSGPSHLKVEDNYCQLEREDTLLSYETTLCSQPRLELKEDEDWLLKLGGGAMV